MDSPYWDPWDRLIPFTDARLAKLLIHRPDSNQAAGSTALSQHDRDIIMGFVLEAAAAVLTDRQYQIFVGVYVQGKSQIDVARDLGIKQPTVYNTIFGRGDCDNDGVVGGCLRKIQAYLAVHEGCKEAMAKIKEEIVKEATPTTAVKNFRGAVAGWFKDLRANQLNTLFVPLAVLIVLEALGNQKRQVRLDDLVAVMPRAVVDESLRQLRLNGYIAHMGTYVQIIKTPGEGDAND